MTIGFKSLMTRSMAADAVMTGMAAPGPRRPMRWPTLAVIIGGSILFIIAVVGALFFTFRPVTLRIAVGPPGSEDSRTIQAIVQGFARERNIRLRMVNVGSGGDSASVFAAGNVDLAVVRGDADLPKNAQAVAILRKNYVTIWTPMGLGKGPTKPKLVKGKKAEPIPAKIENLVGHKIGLIGYSPANAALLKLILAQYGVPVDKVTITQFSTNDVANAVRHQSVDAFVGIGPLNSKITADAIAASVKNPADLKFFEIDSAEAIAENHPIYEAGEIPAGAFSSAPARPEEAVPSLSFAHYIVAQKGLSEATIGAFTRQLFSVRQNVIGDAPGVAKIETPDTAKDAAIPAHPGAAAYVDGEERTFLDRYSDYMWGGLMLLSVMGSAGAWFASYIRRDERTANTADRGRLLDMITAARSCNSLDELDHMQTEADQILRDTLTCYEDGAIEQGTLTAFNIALDQFHNAVADRKTLLTSQPAVLRATAQLRA